MSVVEPEDFRRLQDRVHDLASVTQTADAKIELHEAVCAERYKGIDEQLWWVRWLLIAMIVVTLLEPRTWIPAVFKSWGIEMSVSSSGGG